MNTFLVIFVAIQACLVQNVFSQCGCGNYGGGYSSPPIIAPAPISAGCGGPRIVGSAGSIGYGAPSPAAAAYSAIGEGNVAVAGELPVSGNTAVIGQVPILGAVTFSGSVPAAGAVSINGRCSCDCSCAY